MKTKKDKKVAGVMMLSLHWEVYLTIANKLIFNTNYNYENMNKIFIILIISSH